MTLVETIILVVTIGLVALIFACGLIQKLYDMRQKETERNARLSKQLFDQLGKVLQDSISGMLALIEEHSEKQKKQHKEEMKQREEFKWE